jgi:hypothetical protein
MVNTDWLSLLSHCIQVAVAAIESNSLVFSKVKGYRPVSFKRYMRQEDAWSGLFEA